MVWAVDENAWEDNTTITRGRLRRWHDWQTMKGQKPLTWTPAQGMQSYETYSVFRSHCKYGGQEILIEKYRKDRRYIQEKDKEKKLRKTNEAERKRKQNKLCTIEKIAAIRYDLTEIFLKRSPAVSQGRVEVVPMHSHGMHVLNARQDIDRFDCCVTRMTCPRMPWMLGHQDEYLAQKLYFWDFSRTRKDIEKTELYSKDMMFGYPGLKF